MAETEKKRVWQFGVNLDHLHSDCGSKCLPLLRCWVGIDVVEFFEFLGLLVGWPHAQFARKALRVAVEMGLIRVVCVKRRMIVRWCD